MKILQASISTLMETLGHFVIELTNAPIFNYMN